MGRREEARAESAFMRGEVGIDGGRTDEVEGDVAELERGKARDQLLRGRTWLGRELLTWLLWRSESGDPIARHQEEDVVALFVGRITLRGIQGDVVELSAKGAMAPYSVQVRRALHEGLLVHAARLRLTVGERVWEASLDAEFLDIKSAKLPELLTEEEDDRLTERLDLAEQLSSVLDGLVRSFLELRASRSWAKQVIPELRTWMAGEGAEPAGRTLERARRVRAV